VTATSFNLGAQRETVKTTDHNWRNVQLTLEMKI